MEINAIISDLEKQHDRIPTADNVVAYLAILKQQMNDFNFRDRSSSRLYTRSSTAIKRGDMSSIQQSDIVKLHARLIKCQEKADANQRRWEALISDIRKMQVLDVVTSYSYHFNNWILEAAQQRWKRS